MRSGLSSRWVQHLVAPFCVLSSEQPSECRVFCPGMLPVEGAVGSGRGTTASGAASWAQGRSPALHSRQGLSRLLSSPCTPRNPWAPCLSCGGAEG